MLYNILLSNLFIVLSLPIINPSLSSDYNNGTSLNIISQTSDGVDNLKTSQFGTDLTIESLIKSNNNITSSTNNSTSPIKPIDKKSGQNESNDDLINIQLHLGAGGTKKSNDLVTPSAAETPLPPIDSTFNQDQWNVANNEIEIPLNSANINKDTLLDPLAYQSPQPKQNTLDLNLQLKKLALSGISSMLIPIRPLLVGIDKSAQLFLDKSVKSTANVPLIGPALKQLKLNSIPDMSGHLDIKNLIDLLIVTGDIYSDDE